MKIFFQNLISESNLIKLFMESVLISDSNTYTGTGRGILIMHTLLIFIHILKKNIPN